MLSDIVMANVYFLVEVIMVTFLFLYNKILRYIGWNVEGPLFMPFLYKIRLLWVVFYLSRLT